MQESKDPASVEEQEKHQCSLAVMWSACTDRGIWHLSNSREKRWMQSRSLAVYAKRMQGSRTLMTSLEEQQERMYTVCAFLHLTVKQSENSQIWELLQNLGLRILRKNSRCVCVCVIISFVSLPQAVCGLDCKLSGSWVSLQQCRRSEEFDLQHWVQLPAPYSQLPLWLCWIVWMAELLEPWAGSCGIL